MHYVKGISYTFPINSTIGRGRFILLASDIENITNPYGMQVH